jgi:hypothetical protein
VDRRNDSLFRGLVDCVLPGLAHREFTLEDRGTFGELRWVEFARRRSDPRVAQLSEQNLVLYHLAEHQHVGARLTQRNVIGSAPTQPLAAEVWPYAVDAPLTPDGHSISTLMYDWVAAVVDGTAN